MATQETKSRKTGALKGATLAIFGLVGLAGMERMASGLACFFGIPLNMALETLPSILLTAWHMLQPCAFGHFGLLEDFLQVSLSWHALMLTGA